MFFSRQRSGQRGQMRQRQLPGLARAMLLTARQDFGREHARDLEQLKLDRIATGGGRGIDKAQRPRQIPPVIAGRFGDEKGRSATAHDRITHPCLNGF